MQSLAGKRVAVYARYSTDKQNPRSIADQVRVCSEYAARLGGEVALVFSDEAISGSIAERPGLAALQDAVRERRVDAVVCEDLSRIGRDIGDNDRVLKRFRSWGAALLAVDGFSTENSGAIVMSAMKSAMAEEYLRELKQRTRRGLEGSHAQGKSTGGRCYGYRTQDARLVIDEREAAIVRRIFAEHCAGHGYREIAAGLNRDGIAATRGKWGHTSVRAVLRNERYIGVVAFGAREWSRDMETGRRRYRRSDRTAIKRRADESLRIIDAVTWAEAQTRARAVAAVHASGKRPRTSHPLSGLLACADCGEPMTVVGRAYYACSGHKKGHGCENRASLREVDIRAWLLDGIVGALGEESILGDMRAALAKQIGDHDRSIRAELQERRAQLARTEAALSRLYDALGDGDASPTLRAKIREREDHADLQRAAIAALEQRLGHVPRLPSREEIGGFVRALPALVAGRPAEARLVLTRLLGGPVRCAPPARRGETYSAHVELRASEILTHTATVAGAVYASGGCGGAISPLAYSRTIALSGPVPRLRPGKPMT